MLCNYVVQVKRSILSTRFEPIHDWFNCIIITQDWFTNCLIPLSRFLVVQRGKTRLTENWWYKDWPLNQLSIEEKNVMYSLIHFPTTFYLWKINSSQFKSSKHIHIPAKSPYALQTDGPNPGRAGVSKYKRAWSIEFPVFFQGCLDWAFEWFRWN